MSIPTESYLKVHYELRPAKQVERRMLVDSLQLLTSDFPIRDYQYTGMGSIYFIDFILFHRLLGITKMLSVEYSTRIRKRVEFNRPFECVKTRIAPIGDVIPGLSDKDRHILWLDYDGTLQDSHLADVASAATFLSAGSILLVTVDVEAPTNTASPSDWRDYYKQQANDYFDLTHKDEDFAFSLLPSRNVEYIDKAIKSGLSGRSDFIFIPMFNFEYKDGHKMLTIGGMIGKESDAAKVRGNPLSRTAYFRADFASQPCSILVPRLTRRERHYLDQFMPCENNWVPSEFELDSDLVTAYRDIYRYCPSYAELLA